ncbi:MULTISPECIES: hypothetical protein [unclassified Methylophaga]|jgi:ElaB/YqjD/DUF883 family membrane-anchored ribosome-binding protein|uniref:hypothetical protein n=3 Tax=Methylophaga TaxID=40222 RepID=UPI000C4899A3|nr:MULTISPECIES: hypothetical protein [unclassified Methylophaga]MAL50599.1 hypothetical protein [Methylophaga sp.]MBP25785.1 hypothetical protein [Methylophaga sp.]|tara:strand:- start:17140 stop:18123 length:984 start_codon:yes stop_codon:yes gene_type:complete
MTDSTLHTGPYVSNHSTLTAIIAGTVVALGLMVMFTLLGLSLGIASLEAIGDGLGIGAAIYIVVTQLISLAVGGFAAARFMTTFDTNSAALAGLAVWALTTLSVAYMGLSAGTSAISTSSSLVAQTVETSAGAVKAITPEDISLPDMSEISGSISMADLPPQLQQALQEAGVTPSQLRAEAREAFRNVISQQEMNRARSLVTATLSDIVAQPHTFSEEMNNLLDRLVIGENAVFNEEDLNQAQNTLEMRLGITPAQAQELVNEVQELYNSAVETLRQTVSELQEQIIAEAKDIQDAVAAAALWLFIASLLGLGAATAAGVFGRRSVV